MESAVRPVQLAGPALLVAGLASLAYGMVQGEATLSLFVIFPIITATGGWAILGIALLVAGFFVFFLTGFRPTDTVAAPAVPATSPGAGTGVPARSHRWGGVVFLGPFPVVFGSDAKVTRWMLVAGLVLFVALAVLTVIALWGI